MNKYVKRYLARATRGTWGKKRAIIREELTAHIQERVETHRVGGLSEADAVEKVLGELGSPHEVSAGMTRLHSMPTLLGSSFLFTAALVLSMILLSESIAQVLTPLPHRPVPACFDAGSVIDFRDECFTQEIYVNVNNLADTLEAQGVTATVDEGALSLSFPQGESTKFTYAEGTAYGENGYALDDVYQPTNEYASIWTIINRTVESTDLPITVSGWNNPTVTLGDAEFILGDEDTPVSGQAFYNSYLLSIAFGSSPSELTKSPVSPLFTMRNSGIWMVNENTYEGAPQNALTVGEGVYALLMQDVGEPSEPSDKGDAHFWIEVAEADSRGVVQFHRAPENFAVNFEGADVAVLIRLTGELNEAGDGFGYEIIPPDQITVE